MKASSQHAKTGKILIARNKHSLASADKLVRKIIVECARRGLYCLERLENSKDNESLHDLRVAMRQLRVNIHIFRPFLPKSVSSDLVEQVKSFTSLTGETRNTEVQLSWLKEHRRKLKAADRAACDQICASLQGVIRSGYSKLNKEFSDNFEILLKQIIRHVRISRRPKTKSKPFSIFFTRRLKRLTNKVCKALDMIKTGEGCSDLHELRIRTKKLRYFLVSFEGVYPQIKESISKIKELQDLLGDIHDLILLQDRLAVEFSGFQSSSGFEALEKLIDSHRLALLGKFKKSWLNSNKVEHIKRSLKKICEKGRIIETVT